jgi:hypothetical protein
MKTKSKYLLMDEIGKRLTVDVVVIPVHFFSFLPSLPWPL